MIEVVLRTMPRPSQKTRRDGAPRLLAVSGWLGSLAQELALESLLEGDGGWAGRSDVLEEAVIACAVGPCVGGPDIAGGVDCDADFAGSGCR